MWTRIILENCGWLIFRESEDIIEIKLDNILALSAIPAECSLDPSSRQVIER